MVFDPPQNTALQQAHRAHMAEPSGPCIENPVKKRELTPEQKAKRAEIMAKARAARKPKVDQAAPDSAPVQVVPAEE